MSIRPASEDRPPMKSPVRAVLATRTLPRGPRGTDSLRSDEGDTVVLDLCPHCLHLIAHHGPQGCEHTPGYDDPYAHPSYYAGEPRDCECAHEETARPTPTP